MDYQFQTESMSLESLIQAFLNNTWVLLAVTIGAILVIPWFLLDLGTRSRNFLHGRS